MWDPETKLKQFKDPVHGYISVPAGYCEILIDTPLFQRLRGIEQTSMRCLYPAARHDRFIHSLGVYHLAELAFDFLKRNTSAQVLDGIRLDAYKDTFLIAALMHDCGHAPFSHLFERYYNDGSQARNLLYAKAGTDFQSDYERNCDERGSTPAAHEDFSAYLLYCRAEEIKARFSAFDPLLAARMITGCVYNSPGDDRAKRLENCLIKLLNGDAIDVDKLDYIVRDTWASGVSNVTIDIHRLLSALEVVEKDSKLCMAYNKSALSVIQNVIAGRNFLYRWIYNHHTVLYNNYLLETALKQIDQKIPDHLLLKKIFSPQAFNGPVKQDPYEFYLPCDGDIYYLMKNFINSIPEIKELISRHPCRVPLWKTYAEFKNYFGGNSDIITHLKNNAGPVLSQKFPLLSNRFLTLPAKAKYVDIKEDELWIQLSPKNVISYTDTLDQPHWPSNAVEYFYVYIPRELNPMECIEELNKV